MQPLQALHQKLDVANAAGRELDIEAVLQAAPGGQLLADSLARFGDRLHRAEIQRALVDQRLDELQQSGARLGLAGRNPRLDQHLLFPVARALFVVGFGPVFGNRDLAQRAVGPQAQIHPVALALGGVGGEQGGVLVGDFLVKLLVAQAGRAVGLAVAAMHEHQVDIGAVVQLFAPQLAQRNHREAARPAVGKARLTMAGDELRANSHVRHAQDGVGQVRKLLDDIGKSGHPQNVAQNDAQQLAAAEARQIHRRGHAQVLRAQKLEEALLILVHRMDAVEAARTGHLQEAFRVLQHGLGKEAAVAEEIHRPLQRGRRVADAVESRRRCEAQPFQRAHGRLLVRRRSQKQLNARGDALRKRRPQPDCHYPVERTRHASGQLGHD